jgi:hypothetical protein
MGTNTLETAYANGQIIDASHINELTASLLGAVIGRDNSGVPELGKSLGTGAIPWGNLYANGIILNGFAVDTSQITSLPNRVVSGQTRALSSLSDFLRAKGSALEFDILGATTDLVLSINNTAVSISSNLNKTGVVAAPSINNTANINDSTIVNSLYAGESDSENPVITINAVGSEVSSKVGEIVAFKTPTGEIFQGLLKTATSITNVFRGYYLDSSGNAIKRGVLSHNDTITLMSIGWVFVEDNGTTVDVATLTPVIAYNAPSSPITGQYWFDITNQVWKRYSGTSFDIINRILIGQVISDGTNTIASRSYDFSNSFEEFNNLETEIDTAEIIKTVDEAAKCSVYGTEVQINLSKLSWNITTDLESPLVEASSTDYYLYLSDQGQEIISDQKPHQRKDLKGFYHPHHSWRCVGVCFNDSSSNLVLVSHVPYNSEVHEQEIIIFDEKTTNADGGTFTAGAWQTRDLNTVKGDSIALVDTNQVRLLAGACDQIISSSAPAYKVDSHKSKLRDITKSVDIAIGKVTSSDSSVGGDTTNSTIEHTMKVDVSKSIELQHYAQATRTTTGFGFNDAGDGEVEIYSVLKLIRRK